MKLWWLSSETLMISKWSPYSFQVKPVTSGAQRTSKWILQVLVGKSSRPAKWRREKLSSEIRKGFQVKFRESFKWCPESHWSEVLRDFQAKFFELTRQDLETSSKGRPSDFQGMHSGFLREVKIFFRVKFWETEVKLWGTSKWNPEGYPSESQRCFRKLWRLV